MLKLSVVIPSHNAEATIFDAITSILQDEITVEIVIQDGASTDGTVNIVNGFSEKVKWTSEPDSGQTQALNRALSRSTGDIIGWLNADDIYADGALEMVCRIFAENPKVDVVYGDFCMIDLAGNLLRTYQVSEWDWMRFRTRGCYVFSGATFFRRVIFEQFGLFDEGLHYCMDYEFFLRIGRKINSYHLNIPLASFRVHAGSKSGTSSLQFAREAYMIRSRYPERSILLRLADIWSLAGSILYGSLSQVRWSRTWSKLRSRKHL